MLSILKLKVINRMGGNSCSSAHMDVTLGLLEWIANKPTWTVSVNCKQTHFMKPFERVFSM